MDGFTPGLSGGGCCCEMGGGADCEGCAMSWDHYDRDRVSDGNKQFLLVASGDFRHSMRIRQEVGSHLRNMISLSEPVKLEPHNGRVYHVEVRGELGDIVLRSGWNEFVNAYHIEENDSILFVYRGNSRFEVRVFSSAGHEKSLSCSPPPSGIPGPVPPFTPCNHHVQNEQVVPNPGHVTSIDFDYTMLPGCHLTKAQDEKVLEIAHTRRSEVPLYVAAMSTSNVSLKNCYVYIPLRLVGRLKEEIKLEAPDNNTYSVGASKHSDDLIVMESGWNVFVASLRIQENDLLIFRSMGKTHLEVLILDPSGREKTSSCSVMGNRSSSAQEICDDSVEVVDPPPPQIIDLTGSDDDDIMGEGTGESYKAQKRAARSCAKAQKLASTSSPSTKSGSGAGKRHDRASVKLVVGSEPLSNNFGGPSQRPYILALQATLPLQVKRKVEEKVQAIRSELPIYVKVMTTASGHSEMYFSMGYASACLPGKTQTLFLQLEGRKKLWHAKLRVTSRKQRRFYSGWLEFVRDNQVKAGDVCLFQLASSNPGSVTMTVHLIRESETQM